MTPEFNYLAQYISQYHKFTNVPDLYTLIADGKEVDTKKMILTK